MSSAGHARRLGRLEQRILASTRLTRNPLADRIQAIKLALGIGTVASWTASATAQQAALLQRAALASPGETA